MRKIYGLILLALPLFTLAQQDIQFTQYMHNRLFYNAGVAGSGGALCITGIHRSQWVGFDGAPTTQNITANIPIKVLHGGLSVKLTQDVLGNFNHFYGGLGYAYQAKVGSGTLGFGLMGEFSSTSVGTDQWITPDDNAFPIAGQLDGAIPANASSGISIDLGFGIYYQNNKVWGGISTGRLTEALTTLESRNPTAGLLGLNDVAGIRNKRHYYGMFGYDWQLPASSWTLQPSFLVKSDFASSLTADVNLTGLYNNKFWMGVSYRLEDAVGVNLGYQILPSLKAGYAYDVPIGELSSNAGGSHEIFLRYCVKIVIPPPAKGSYKNPRFL